jgi:hypothetical protein
MVSGWEKAMEMQNAVLKLLYDGHKNVNKSTLHLLCVQWDNLHICRLCSSPSTSADTGGVPVDCPLITLPLRLNLLIAPLMWTSKDVSWVLT